MDINKYITENKGLLNQVQFKIVLGMDMNNKHIPTWFKDKRVIALIDYCINEGLIDKNKIQYSFSHKYDPNDFKFISFKIYELSLDGLNQLSYLLPTPDLSDFIKFKTSEPYHVSKFSVTSAPKNKKETTSAKVKSFYDLTCMIDKIDIPIGTILIN